MTCFKRGIHNVSMEIGTEMFNFIDTQSSNTNNSFSLTLIFIDNVAREQVATYVVEYLDLEIVK